MARPTTLPEQATTHAAAQAQEHLPTQLPPEHDDILVFTAAITESRTLPAQALANAAEQAQEHLPTELPAVQSPHELTLPEAAGHMSDVATPHLPDWFVI